MTLHPARLTETKTIVSDRSGPEPVVKTDADDRTRYRDDPLQIGERAVIAGVLALIALLAGADLLVDQRQGVSVWHVLIEAMVAVAACFGAFHLLPRSGTPTICSEIARLQIPASARLVGIAN
jgi:uncharacterized membrane protein